MRLPDLIRARCLVGDTPFPGAWLALSLIANEGDAEPVFSLVFGPAGEDGRIFVERDEVLAQARFLGEAIGLDYGRIEERWSGKLALAVAGVEELRHQFRLTFGDPPVRRASFNRVAAARALRLLHESAGEELSVEASLEPSGTTELEFVLGRARDWLPEELHEPVLELLVRLARRDLAGLVEAGVLAEERQTDIEDEIARAGVTPILPPDIALLLARAESCGEQAWAIAVPLWTKERGPSDLEVSLSALEQEGTLTLTLEGVAPE